MWSIKPSMKLKIPLSTIVFGLFILFAVVFVVKIKLSENPSEPKSVISESATSTTNKNIREIKVIAKQYSFSPDVIRFSLNEKIKFRIVSGDVTHGFSVPELGIDQIIEPGKETIIDFQPTKKGTYHLLCSVTCGAGHSEMKGSIIIE